MEAFAIPGRIWINLVLLVAAAIFVGVRLAAAEKTGRRKPEPVSPGVGQAIE